MDIFEDDSEQTENEFVQHDLLARFWRNERCAPSLLPYQDRLMQHTNELGMAHQPIDSNFYFVDVVHQQFRIRRALSKEKKNGYFKTSKVDLILK